MAPRSKKTISALKPTGRSSALEKARAAKAKKNLSSQKARAKEIEKANVKAAEGTKLLTPIAKEIRARLERAHKAEGQALDRRTSAAIYCGQARTIAEKHGVSFRKWWGEQIEAKMPEEMRLSYKTAIELSSIVMEAKGDEEKARKLMIESRADTRTRMAAKRAKTGAARNGSTPGPIAQHSSTVFDNLDKAFNNFTSDLGEDAEAKYIKDRATKLGLVVHSEAAAAKVRKDASYEEAQSYFLALSGAERMRFVEWAAKEVGGTFTIPDVGGMAAETGDDGMDIPTAMQRGKKTNGRGAKRQTAAG